MQGNPLSGVLSRLEPMRRLTAFALALAAIAALCVGLSACGGDDQLVPKTAAQQINANLDEVRALVGEGDCEGAGEVANSVADQVAELDNVAKKLKEALDEGAARLSEVVAACEEAPSEGEEEAALREAEEAGREAEEEAEDEQRERQEKEKPAQEKAEKDAGPAAEPPEAPEPPGQEKKEEAEVPPTATEDEGNSGGLGPGAAVEGGD
jgi:flagellar hook-basal body complex protein FliE